jgi:mono/diheme cytochrome c family protein
MKLLPMPPSLRDLLLSLLVVVPLAAWAADVFDFIPAGGRTLAARALGERAADAEVTGLIAGRRSRADWMAYLGAHAAAWPALKALDDQERLTLADYLAHNMPLGTLKPPARPDRAYWEKNLPPDGRDLALRYCQGCHIITVVVTQQRTREAWLGTMGKPSHIQIKLRPEQREALADYLVLHGGIPIEQVPEPLRAGGATY